MGFALVLAWMIGTALIFAGFTLVVAIKFGKSAKAGGMTALLWLVFAVAWWSAVAGPSEHTPSNVQILSAPVIYYGVLAVLFVLVWIFFAGLFALFNRTPKGNKTAAVILGLFLIGFWLTRRISAGAILLTVIVVALALAIVFEKKAIGKVLPGGLSSLIISFLIVYITAALCAGFAHDIQPLTPVPADQDEVFYSSAIRRLGWIYFGAILIIIISVVLGIITKNVWVGIAVFFVAYLLFSLLVFIFYFVKAWALLTPLLEQIPGFNVSKWIADIGKTFGWTEDFIAALQDLASPTVEVGGSVDVNADEQGWLPALLGGIVND